MILPQFAVAPRCRHLKDGREGYPTPATGVLAVRAVAAHVTTRAARAMCRVMGENHDPRTDVQLLHAAGSEAGAFAVFYRRHEPLRLRA